ncbi:MAG TPA: glucan biosynthesis protein [Opitutaceae bacterium]|jgi:glucans biosynthesis protein|nr:glucan biosynthesis protein [Opitutaceae bacterium]
MRRGLVILAALTAAAAGKAAPAPTFDFDVLSRRAQAMAHQPYHRRAVVIPEWLKKLSYDQYRDIRFKPPESWWNRDPVPFKLQFFHPGFIYGSTVKMYELDDGRPVLIPFERKMFDYGHNKAGDLPPDFGFGGFRIHYPLNHVLDELGVFQGASYFRFLCRRAVYGLSARGIAINTAVPGKDEEFPDFTEFWVQKPSGPTANEILVYALLDGPSVTGAYRFAIDPGADTVVRVRAVIYCRSNPAVLGLAPLTSMYWHGKTSNFETDDIRPEVHDSDGLMIHNGADEWLWRPLTNPAISRTMSFSDDDPKGFGLLQRERRYEAYQDLEAVYQLRPSAWVEPVNHWGPGAVRLVELHTPNETNDNIVAFWVPATLPPAGEPIEIEYNIHWFMDQIRPPLGYTVNTRYGKSHFWEPEMERFVIEFDSPELQHLGANERVDADVTVGDGAMLVHADAMKNPFTGTWRAFFAVKDDGSGRPVELRCRLRRQGHDLTEVWTYLWQP